MLGGSKQTAAQARNAFVELWYKGLLAAERAINVANLFHFLSPMHAADVKSRIPYVFVPPPAAPSQVADVARPKPEPEPKAAPRQSSMASFLSQQWGHVLIHFRALETGTDFSIFSAIPTHCLFACCVPEAYFALSAWPAGKPKI